MWKGHTFAISECLCAFGVIVQWLSNEKGVDKSWNCCLISMDLYWFVGEKVDSGFLGAQ